MEEEVEVEEDFSELEEVEVGLKDQSHPSVIHKLFLRD
jgi:hypothetical protein